MPSADYKVPVMNSSSSRVSSSADVIQVEAGVITQPWSTAHRYHPACSPRLSPLHDFLYPYWAQFIPAMAAYVPHHASYGPMAL
jgi:hypothetical protein